MAVDKIQTGLRLEPETLKKITYIAKKEKRSLNAQLEYATLKCIEEYENKNGSILLEEET
jgi:hypothetical protein